MDAFKDSRGLYEHNSCRECFQRNILLIVLSFCLLTEGFLFRANIFWR